MSIPSWITSLWRLFLVARARVCLCLCLSVYLSLSFPSPFPPYFSLPLPPPSPPLPATLYPVSSSTNLSNPNFSPGYLRGLPNAPRGAASRGRDTGTTSKLQPPPLLKPRSSGTRVTTTPVEWTTFGHYILFHPICRDDGIWIYFLYLHFVYRISKSLVKWYWLVGWLVSWFD